MSYLDNLEQNLKSGRFKLPQFQTDSPLVNQAQSDSMRSTASSDIYSGAKEGVSKLVQTALPSPSQDVEEDNSPYTNMQPMEKETTGVVAPSPRTGLANPNEYESDAAKFARQAQSYGQSDIDAERSAMQTANAANTAVGQYDVTKQPVSKTRKALGIGAGIITGILGGGPLGGMSTYDAITRKPALEREAQLEKQASVGKTNLGNTESVAKQAMSNAGELNKAADVMQKVGKDVTEQPKTVADTNKAIAETNAIPIESALKKATTAKTIQETQDLQNPKPTTTPIPENDSILQTTKLKDGTYKNEFITKPAGTDKGIQKLSAGDEPIVRGYWGGKGVEPNDLIAGYRAGDPKSSAMVFEAIQAAKKDSNPGFQFETSTFTPTFDASQKPTGGVIYHPRSDTFTPVTLAEMGLTSDQFIKNPPKPLGATDENALEGANRSKKVIADIKSQLTPEMQKKLGAVAGRMKNFMTEDLGTFDPEVSGLITSLRNLAAFTAATHTGRITEPLINEFKTAVGGIGQNPKNFMTKLDTMLKSADIVTKDIETGNPNAAQVLARKRANMSSEIQKGNVVTHKDGTKWKITDVHPDGTYDADPVKK